MKSILLSIKLKYVAKILNGEKTIEVRKNMPICDLPIDVYIYCTKDKKQGVVWDSEGKSLVFANKFPYDKGSPEHYRLVNGKVVAKFTLRKVEDIIFKGEYQFTRYTTTEEMIKKSCLSWKELAIYLNGWGYAYHIEDLVIFDKPKDLSEFKSFNKPSCDSCPYQHTADCDYYKEVDCEGCIPLTKAPQSYCYVEVNQ